jgi:membrane protein insertase Oxa1/YidC/SpoIIIJ
MTENLILDPVNPDVIATTAAAATDHYLPTVNWLIQAMEYVHHTVPLPWWATIIAFTVGFRTLLLPVIVSTKKNSMKMMALQPGTYFTTSFCLSNILR